MAGTKTLSKALPENNSATVVDTATKRAIHIIVIGEADIAKVSKRTITRNPVTKKVTVPSVLLLPPNIE